MVGKDSWTPNVIDSPQPRDLQKDQIVNGGWEINLCDEFSVEKPTLCGIVDCAPRRDWTCERLWLQGKPPCPWHLFWVVQVISFAFFLFLFLSWRWAFFLKKITPFSQHTASCVCWRGCLHLASYSYVKFLKFYLLIRRMVIQPQLNQIGSINLSVFYFSLF